MRHRTATEIQIETKRFICIIQKHAEEDNNWIEKQLRLD